MIRAIAALGEHHSLERAKFLLNQDFPDIQVIGEAEDSKTALRIIEGLKPDLLLLDLQLPGFGSLETLKQISYQPLLLLITTGHLPLVAALERNEIEYLLKPISREEFAKTLQRTQQRNQRVQERLLAALRSAEPAPHYLSRFIINHGDALRILPAANVHYIKATPGGALLGGFAEEFVYPASIEELAEMLDPQHFCRIQRDCLVAPARVRKLRRSPWRKYTVQLSDNARTVLRVEHRFLPALKKMIAKR